MKWNARWIWATMSVEDTNLAVFLIGLIVACGAGVLLVAVLFSRDVQ